MIENLRHVHLLVEGQTEETVAKQVVAPYLMAHDCWTSTSILVTSRPARGGWKRGGVSRWAKIEGDVRRLLRDPSIDTLTTLIDYYAFPADAPGMATRPPASARARVEHVEDALRGAIGDPRFVPHLVMHELEAWVYAAAPQLADLRGDPRLEVEMEHEAGAVGGPELLDEGPASAPSKRLLRHCPDYDKTLDGPLVIGDCGLDSIRRRCPHADAWLCALSV